MFFILYNDYVSMNMIDWCLTPTLTVVCGSFWCVDKIQNDVTMETEVPK